MQASAHVFQLCAPLPTADHGADPPRKPSANDARQLAIGLSRHGGIWIGPRRNPDQFQRDVVSFRELSPTP